MIDYPAIATQVRTIASRHPTLPAAQRTVYRADDFLKMWAEMAPWGDELELEPCDDDEQQPTEEPIRYANKRRDGKPLTLLTYQYVAEFGPVTSCQVAQKFGVTLGQAHSTLWHLIRQKQITFSKSSVRGSSGRLLSEYRAVVR